MPINSELTVGVQHQVEDVCSNKVLRMKAFISEAETTVWWQSARLAHKRSQFKSHNVKHLSGTHAETQCQVCELPSNITYARASQVQAHDPELGTDRARAGDDLWKS